MVPHLNSTQRLLSDLAVSLRLNGAPYPENVTTAPPIAALSALAWAADIVVDGVLRVARILGALLASLAGRLPGRPPDGAGRRAWRTLTRLLGVRPDVLTNPSSLGMRRLAVAGVVVNVFIVASGGLVRLTKSGLGCPTWPRCTAGSLLPQVDPDIPWTRTVIEFGNRTLTFALLLVAVLVFVAALGLRTQRPDLVRLAVVQPFGVFSQALLGGVTVLSGLHPVSVGAHYLLSAVVLVACVALHVRSMEGDRASRPTLPRTAYRLAYALPVLGFLLLAAGTVVTGAGPHAGDESAPRFTFLGVDTVATMARAHSGLMWLTIAAVVALTILARRSGAIVLVRRTYLLMVVIALQGAIGYLQYLTGVPEQLVLLHVLGSALFWVALLYVRLAARTRGRAEPVRADAAVADAHPVRRGG